MRQASSPGTGRTRRRFAVLTLVAAIIVGVCLWRIQRASRPDRERGLDGARPTGAVAAAPGAVPPSAGTGLPEAPARALVPTRVSARTHRPGARTPIPRLLPATTGRGTSDEAPTPPSPQRLQAGGGPLTDRRSEPGPGSEAVLAELTRRLQRADEAANRCLESWAQIDPTLDKGVRMAFTLNAEGLEEVFLEDRAEVPAGPLSCLSGAIYQQDWSGLTDKPVMVTRTLRAEPAERRIPSP